MIRKQKRKNKRYRTLKVLIEKLKNAILNVLFWIGIGIEFLLIIQSYAFLRNGEFLSMLMTGGLSLVPLIGIIIHNSMEDKRRRNAAENRKEFLRNKGIALKVDLSQCRIDETKNTVYYDRQDIPAYSMRDRLNAQTGIPKQSLRGQRANAFSTLMNPEVMHERFSYDSCICIVKTTTAYKGRKKTFTSEPFYVDKGTLGVYLALRKEGFVYVNPKDDKDYFFDLDFLKLENETLQE